MIYYKYFFLQIERIREREAHARKEVISLGIKVCVII